MIFGVLLWNAAYRVSLRGPEVELYGVLKTPPYQAVKNLEAQQRAG